MNSPQCNKDPLLIEIAHIAMSVWATLQPDSKNLALVGRWNSVLSVSMRSLYPDATFALYDTNQETGLIRLAKYCTYDGLSVNGILRRTPNESNQLEILVDSVATGSLVQVLTLGTESFNSDDFSITHPALFDYQALSNHMIKSGLLEPVVACHNIHLKYSSIDSLYGDFKRLGITEASIHGKIPTGEIVTLQVLCASGWKQKNKTDKVINWKKD